MTYCFSVFTASIRIKTTRIATRPIFDVLSLYTLTIFSMPGVHPSRNSWWRYSWYLIVNRKWLPSLCCFSTTFSFSSNKSLTFSCGASLYSFHYSVTERCGRHLPHIEISRSLFYLTLNFEYGVYTHSFQIKATVKWTLTSRNTSIEASTFRRIKSLLNWTDIKNDNCKVNSKI